MILAASGLRVYASALVAATIGIAVVASRSVAPPISATLLFCALMIYTEHRSVDVTEDTAVNAGFLVMLAAVVALHHSLLAVILVGASKGVYVPQLRARAWSLISINATSAALACAAAASLLHRFPHVAEERMPSALVAALPVSATCILVLLGLLVPAFILRGHGLRETLGVMTPAFFESYLPFSVLGFFVGVLYLAIGAPAVLMLIVPILIAREAFASYMRVKESHEETVGMLIRALEQKDHYTAGHAERVATYTRYIGEELNFMPARLERLRFAALMHDIGKLVVPNYLLNKPGRLTAEEFAQVRVHEKVSVQMLSHIDFLRPIAGSGHSDNTKFNPDDPDHPIEPYIVMIADAYDAMTSTRAYRKALSQEVAFKELRDKAGTQFHPQCVEALIHALESRGEIHGAGHEQAPEFVNAPDVGVGSAGLGDLMPTDAR
jgi:hypothetical protein